MSLNRIYISNFKVHLFKYFCCRSVLYFLLFLSDLCDSLSKAPTITKSSFIKHNLELRSSLKFEVSVLW